MSKYLFGMSVKGIQKFIFNTKNLREIIGGSELIEQICSSFFEEHLKQKGLKIESGQKILMAAGKIKYIFNSRQECQLVLSDLEYKIRQLAPGIELATAVVPIASTLSNSHLNDLEEKLKESRNKQYNFMPPALMIHERSRTSGLPAVKREDTTYLDVAQVEKRNAIQEGNHNLMSKLCKKRIHPSQFPYEIEDITKAGSSNWVAVVHADGNSVGNHIQTMIEELKNTPHEVSDVLSEFSTEIEAATLHAVESAYQKIITPVVLEKRLTKLPIRPIVIGGDDITVIVNGAQAVSFTEVYLKSFETLTKDIFSKWDEKYGISSLKNGLSASAGIAFVKPSYPLYYAIDLAEDLCGVVKKKVKKTKANHTPSALLFHKVQSSFVRSYSELLETQLKANTISLSYGPYTLNSNDLELPQLSSLQKKVKKINRQEAPKAAIRSWLSEIHVNQEKANQLMQRATTITNDHFVKDLEMHHSIQKREGKEVTPLYDVMSLASIN